MLSLLKKRLPALVLLPLVFTGCNYFDLGEPRPEEQETQPKAGVLTVIGAEDGVSYRLFALNQRLSPEIFHCSLLIVNC
jgi:hypothetical protein